METYQKNDHSWGDQQILVTTYNYATCKPKGKKWGKSRKLNERFINKVNKKEKEMITEYLNPNITQDIR